MTNLQSIIQKSKERFDGLAKKKGMGGLARLFVKDFIASELRTAITQAIEMYEKEIMITDLVLEGNDEKNGASKVLEILLAKRKSAKEKLLGE